MKFYLIQWFTRSSFNKPVDQNVGKLCKYMPDVWTKTETADQHYQHKQLNGHPNWSFVSGLFPDRIMLVLLDMYSGIPLQYSCLENTMDGAAWWAAVHGVAKSWTRLSDFTFTFHFHALEKEMATHSSVLAWRIPGRGSLVGYHLWGRTESDMTEVT